MTSTSGRSRFSFVGTGPAPAVVGSVLHHLDANENALGTSPRALEAITQSLADTYCYPDNGSFALRAKLAKHCGTSIDQVVCGAGSNEIIRLAAEVFIRPGHHALAPKHSFRMLKLRVSQLARDYVEAATTDLQPDIDDLIAKCGPETGLVYVASPGNPTGGPITAEQLDALCQAIEPPTVVIIDEAYGDYSGGTLSASPGVVLARSRPNVVCLRTFSKIYGLAGLRIGFSISSSEVAGRLEAMRGPYNISVPAQHAALAALEDVEFAEAVRSHSAAWRARLVRQFASHNRRAFDTPTNFVLAELDSNVEALALCGFLESRGIVVKHLWDYGLDRCVRITIGQDPAMMQLIKELESFFLESQSGAMCHAADI